MTVNLTLNDIAAKTASEVLKLIQSIETQPIKQEALKTMVRAEKTAADTESVKQTDVSEFTVEDIRSAFAKFAKVNGKDAAKQLLARFGANKVTELKETDYSVVMKALEEE